MPQKPSKLMPAIYGGVIMGVISGIPFLNFVNCFCCAGVLFGGFMSVMFYKNEIKEGMSALSSGDALQLGALAGVFGAVTSAILTSVIFAVVGNIAGKAMYDMIIGFYDKAGMLNQMPPDALERLEQSIEEGGLTVLRFVLSLIIDPLFGLLGGLIGYAVFKPKPVVMNTPPPAAPPAQN